MLPQGGYRYPLLLLTATAAAAAAHECVSIAGDEEGGLLCSDLALLGTNPPTGVCAYVWECAVSLFCSPRVKRPARR